MVCKRMLNVFFFIFAILDDFSKWSAGALYNFERSSNLAKNEEKCCIYLPPTHFSTGFGYPKTQFRIPESITSPMFSFIFFILFIYFLLIILKFYMHNSTLCLHFGLFVTGALFKQLFRTTNRHASGLSRCCSFSTDERLLVRHSVQASKFKTFGFVNFSIWRTICRSKVSV